MGKENAAGRDKGGRIPIIRISAFFRAEPSPVSISKKGDGLYCDFRRDLGVN